MIEKLFEKKETLLLEEKPRFNLARISREIEIVTLNMDRLKVQFCWKKELWGIIHCIWRGLKKLFVSLTLGSLSKRQSEETRKKKKMSSSSNNNNSNSGSGEAEIGTGKTIFVIAVVLGCFAVLYPKIFYHMMFDEKKDKPGKQPLKLQIRVNILENVSFSQNFCRSFTSQPSRIWTPTDARTSCYAYEEPTG